MTTVALVGYGYWGPNLLRNYRELPQAQVTWVCDPRPEALEKAVTHYPSVRATTDFEDVLTDPDVEAVLVATPITTHHPLAKAALEAGKHVFVEKPIAASATQAAELAELADAADLTCPPGFFERPYSWPPYEGV
jgi:predicted dehydrogenase